MRKKNPSKSFSEKRPIPNCLPPLLKHNTGNEEKSSRDACSTTRPPFIIRKKNSSFMESYTTRKQPEICPNQENKNKIHKIEHAVKQQPLIEIHKNSHDISMRLAEKETHPAMDIILFKLDEKKYTASDENVKKKVGQEVAKGEKAEQGMNTSKSLMKKNLKKRKIEQCKTHKINWGSSQKNQVFDLAISAIKVNEDETSNAPIESLKELYIQMF